VELAEEGGLPFVNLKCFVRDGGFRRDGIKRFVGEAKPNQHVRPGDIVMAVTDMTQERRIIARAARVPRLAEPLAAFSMDVVKIEPRAEEMGSFLYAL
jgi:type I restriction enzyme, S subunit